MKTTYLYKIVNNKGATVDVAGTRDEARNLKNYYNSFGNSTKIVQLKYTLTEQKVVR